MPARDPTALRMRARSAAPHATTSAAWFHIRGLRACFKPRSIRRKSPGPRQDPACARSSSLLQRPSSTLLELSIPLPYRLSKCPNSPRDLGLAASLRQPRRFHPPLVECFKDLCELACSACRSCPAAPGNKLQYSTLKPKPSSPLRLTNAPSAREGAPCRRISVLRRTRVSQSMWREERHILIKAEAKETTRDQRSNMFRRRAPQPRCLMPAADSQPEEYLGKKSLYRVHTTR